MDSQHSIKINTAVGSFGRKYNELRGLEKGECIVAILCNREMAFRRYISDVDIFSNNRIIEWVLQQY